MIAQQVFNLPTMPETAPQLGIWGVLIFFAIIVAVIVYLARALPRGEEGPGAEDEDRGGPGTQ